VQVFCGWCLIIQVASKMPTRGVLIDEDGALTASDLSAKTGYPEAIFTQALLALCRPDIAWMEEVDWPQNGESPATSRNFPPEGNRREGKGTEGQEKKCSRADARPPSITDAQWLGLLKADATYAGIDIDREYGKMLRWCEVNNRKPTRRRFMNWLNRVERPMNGSANRQPNHTDPEAW
jgi:hypothetical protein